VTTHTSQSTTESTPERHQNPNKPAQEGNLSQIGDHLAGVLGDRLNRSTVQITRGQYRNASEVVGPAFRERLEQFVSVANRTETESDDRLAGQLERTARTQRNVSEQLQEFNDTRREYRQARRRGNETRARRLARELTRSADRMRASRDFSFAIMERFRIRRRSTSNATRPR